MLYELNKRNVFNAVSVLIHEVSMRRALEQCANNPETRNSSHYISENGIISRGQDGAKLYFRSFTNCDVREIERYCRYEPQY